jgi:hypothetical protein
MTQDFDEAMEFPNEISEEVQCGRQEREDNAAEDKGSKENESDPEDQGDGIFQEVIVARSREFWGDSSETLGAFDSQTRAQKPHTDQELLDTVQLSQRCCPAILKYRVFKKC